MGLVYLFRGAAVLNTIVGYVVIKRITKKIMTIGADKESNFQQIFPIWVYILLLKSDWNF